MTAKPVPDQRVGGRYALREQVGRGGFGVVWRAHDTLLQRDVAVKAIEFPAILDEAEQATICARVLREARAAARLNHPGLVTVFDVISEDDRPLIVMELVKAPTLADLVARRGPLPEERVTAIGLDVLDALGAAHGQGIIHRDVKPANVMVSDTGHVQLGDFGIAAVIDDPKLTNSGNLAGSPSYMAPEQAESRPPSAATDLWGLGATLYFAVEGQPPFAEAGAIATLTSVVNTPHRPLQRATTLAPLIDDLLAKDAEARPTAAETRRRLTEVLAGAPAVTPDPTATAQFDPREVWDPTPAPPPIPASPSAPVAEPAPAAKPVPPATEPEAEPNAAETAPAAEPAPPVTEPAAPVVVRDVEPLVVAADTVRTEREPQSAPAKASVHPAPADAETSRDRDRRTVGFGSRHGVAIALLLGVVVLAAVLVASLRSDDDGMPSTAAPGTATSPSGAESSPPAGATDATPAVPADWVPYQDPATGFTISRPPNWTVRTEGTLTDFRDPASGAYLRVDHVTPPGASPEGDWYEFEPTFAAQNASYKRLQITPTTYQGYPAAIWEFTYSGGGAELRAVDLGFIAGNYGFALNFQTRAPDWDRLQPIFDAFKASFRAPAS